MATLRRSLILLDTEYTAWEGSLARDWGEDWEHREIIQLAALKAELRGGSLQRLEEFNEFVRPAVNPELSDYISGLTGITQSMLGSASATLAPRAISTTRVLWISPVSASLVLGLAVEVP